MKTIAECKLTDGYTKFVVIEADSITHADKIPYWIVEHYIANKVEYAWLHYSRREALSLFFDLKSGQSVKFLKVLK